METIFPFMRYVTRGEMVLRVFAFVILTALLNPDPQRPFDLVISLLLGIMLYASFVGRLRHAGFSPWVSLTFFIPVLGWIVVLVFVIWRGLRSAVVDTAGPTA